jgi:uncharacterized membrane protein (UPF0127 family)
MKAVNLTRYALLGDKVAEARTSLSRSKGLLGTETLRNGEGLWIFPCRSIHSIGMRYEFDALFVDRNGKVVGACRRFRKNRISPIFWRAKGVLELPAGTIDRTDTRVGDVIEFQRAGRCAAGGAA